MSKTSQNLSNTCLFVKTSNFELQYKKNLSKKKLRRFTLLINLSSAQCIVKF
jgi:hypothetical protein